MVPPQPLRTVNRLKVFGLIIITACGSRPALAACPAQPAQIEATTRLALKAFAAMDTAAFDKAHSVLAEELTCLSAVPTTAQVAAVHEVEALAAFRSKDFPTALSCLQGMHEADPTWTLSKEVAPPGGPLSRLDRQALALPPSSRGTHPLEVGWTLVVDGNVGLAPPVSRDALVIFLGPDRAVAWSGLASASKLPSTIGQPGVHGAPPSDRSPQRARFSSGEGALARPAVPLLIAAGGSALVSGGLWLAFAPGFRQIRTIDGMPDGDRGDGDWAKVDMAPMSADEVEALYDRTYRIEIAAEVTTGVAVGLGTVGLVLKW